MVRSRMASAKLWTSFGRSQPTTGWERSSSPAQFRHCQRSDTQSTSSCEVCPPDGLIGIDSGFQRGTRAQRGGHGLRPFWVNDVKEDFSLDQSKTVATEIVGTSISSAGVPYETFSALLPQNPHIRFFESRQRGYVLCTAGNKQMDVELKVVDTVREPVSSGKTLATFVVESGKAGAVRV